MRHPISFLAVSLAGCDLETMEAEALWPTLLDSVPDFPALSTHPLDKVPHPYRSVRTSVNYFPRQLRTVRNRKQIADFRNSFTYR
jgi:hypothetical protein